MKDFIPAQLFVFGGAAQPADWITPDEIVGLENLMMRADCHGGEQDIFLLCLKERTVLFQFKKEADCLQALGLAFPASDRRYWYYIPELVSVLLQTLKEENCARNFQGQKRRDWNLEIAKLAEEDVWLREQYPELMRAIDAFQEDTRHLLYPHSVAFTHLDQQLYCAEGIRFYCYQADAALGLGEQKVLALFNKKSKQPSLYLKPPRLLHTWTLSDRHDKVKFEELMPVQDWNPLHERIMRAWETAWDGDET